MGEGIEIDADAPVKYRLVRRAFIGKVGIAAGEIVLLRPSQAPKSAVKVEEGEKVVPEEVKAPADETLRSIAETKVNLK